MGMVPPETAARLMAPTGRERRRWEACAQRRRTEANVAGLPLSLVIAIWLVGAMWIVALVSNYFSFSSDLIWSVLFLGTGVALIEWRALRNK